MKTDTTHRMENNIRKNIFVFREEYYSDVETVETSHLLMNSSQFVMDRRKCIEILIAATSFVHEINIGLSPASFHFSNAIACTTDAKVQATTKVLRSISVTEQNLVAF